MRSDNATAAVAEIEVSGEFGTGLKARLELVRTREEAAAPPPAPRRDISPELVLISPELEDFPLGGFADMLLQTPEARSAPLGALVAEAGLLERAEVDLALSWASESGKRLGEILVERELVSPADIVRLVAAQRGLPFVDLHRVPVDPAAAKLLPGEVVRNLLTLPVGFARGLPVVAVADPTDEGAMNGAQAILHCVRFVASPEDAILGHLSRLLR
jgi:MshEN domain